ncbi:MAG: carboxypeptidase-like regulatory domain-containing protein [Acidobacteriota bacterium]
MSNESQAVLHRLAFGVALCLCLALGAPVFAVATSSASLIGNPQGPGTPGAAVVGKVLSDEDPLVSASVYAYELADLSLKKAFTDRSGEFVFRSLPAGLYKIIAHKPGFVPAVMLLTRTTAGAYQYIDFALTPESLDQVDGDDYWSIREKIPSDILREIQIAESLEESSQFQRAQDRFEAEMAALTGAGAFSSIGSARLNGGTVGVQGRLGRMDLGVRGTIREFAGASDGAFTGSKLAETSALAVTLTPFDDAQLHVSSHRNQIRSGGGIDLERYGVAWSSDLGPGRSELSAAFTEENNFFSDDRIDAFGAPTASQTWELEGSYEAQLTRRNSLQTGVSYRQRSPLTAASAAAIPVERFDIFGVGGVDVGGGTNLEYGLFTTVVNGQVQLSPHAGVSVELGSNWTAEVAGRHRVTEVDPRFLNQDFIPAFYGHAAHCSQAESDCYRIKITRLLGEHNAVSLGVLQREYTDTLRLFFSEDFLDQLDSLFLVAGDRVPELHFSIDRRLSPSILAHFESNLAEGGGGILQSTDGVPLQNRVRFLVTSLNTHFENTSTAVKLGFHSMQQDLSTLQSDGTRSTAIDSERIQLQVTQDLERLLGFTFAPSSQWALLLDMQVSRGNGILDRAQIDEVRERVVGGIAVSF